MSPATNGDVPVAFGKYRLHRLIAKGGMGEVYLAGLPGALGFEKRLVVKTILPELAADERFVELFAAEAKTAVALSHGNIVPIYELGRHEETYYIAMGYVDGPSVADVLQRHRQQGTRLPLAAALFIVREVLTGMAYAHSNEPGRPAVVHRDLSPRNVLVDRSGQVRIVDFGIAMPARKGVDARMGSLGYCAPEQARAEAADPRADVFSVGCLLYELVTGERAFPKQGVWAPPDPGPVPEDMRPMVDAALDIDPTRRPADAGEFLDRLAPLLSRHAPTYGDKDLAAEIQALFPGGWSAENEPPTAGTTVTPATAIAPSTKTFATRLTAIEASRDHPPSPRHRWARIALLTLLLGAAATALALTMPSSESASVPPATPRRTPMSPAPEPAEGGLAKAPAATDPSEPPPASPKPRHQVTVEIQPADAVLEIDGKRMQEGAPYSIRKPESGPAVQARIHRRGYHPRTITIGPESDDTRHVALKPRTRGRGTLSVLTPTVAWAEVVVDDRKRDNTPLQELALQAGRHHVVVRCVAAVCREPRVLFDAHVRIRAGQETELRVD